MSIADTIVALYSQWSGNPEDAEQLRSSALELHKTLASEHPGVREYQHGLATSHLALAVDFLARENYFGAEPPWQIDFLKLDQRLKALQNRQELDELIKELHAK